MFQEALAIREVAADVLAGLTITGESVIIIIIAQTAENLVSSEEQISGDLMVSQPSAALPLSLLSV